MPPPLPNATTFFNIESSSLFVVSFPFLIITPAELWCRLRHHTALGL